MIQQKSELKEIFLNLNNIKNYHSSNFFKDTYKYFKCLFPGLLHLCKITSTMVVPMLKYRRNVSSACPRSSKTRLNVCPRLRMTECSFCFHFAKLFTFIQNGVQVTRNLVTEKNRLKTWALKE